MNKVASKRSDSFLLLFREFAEIRPPKASNCIKHVAFASHKARSELYSSDFSLVSTILDLRGLLLSRNTFLNRRAHKSLVVSQLLAAFSRTICMVGFSKIKSISSKVLSFVSGMKKSCMTVSQIQLNRNFVLGSCFARAYGLPGRRNQSLRYPHKIPPPGL